MTTSSIYFTSTRNVREKDIINVFEKQLELGIICENEINIVPVLNKNYNHVFFNITWFENLKKVQFLSILNLESSIKIYHSNGKGYWLCRMNIHPLKLRQNPTVLVKVDCFVNNEKNKDNEKKNNDSDDDFYVVA